MPTDALTMFIQDNMVLLLFAIGVVMVVVILFKKLRSVPPKPDFIKIFQEQSIRDESLNKPNKYDPKFLYRGDTFLGKIVSIDDHKYRTAISKEEYKFKLADWEAQLTSVVFIPKWKWRICIGRKKILRFKTSEAKIEEDKLVFPSSAGFTALGNEYITKSSFKEVSTLVEGFWSKRLFEANVNIMASRMSHIASETPEMAHELNLKRLEIERIRAEKERKLGQLI